MTDKEKIECIHSALKEGIVEKGAIPKLLYKYRPFDKYTFDMLKNDYIFLCPAFLLDDKEECTTKKELDRLYDENNSTITKELVDVSLNEVFKYISNEEERKNLEKLTYKITLKNGKFNTNYLVDLRTFLESELRWPKEIVDLLICELKQEEELKDTSVKSKAEIGLNARENIGVCSLSLSPTINKMWKKYTKNHQGYCIEYELEGYEDIEYLFPVTYDNKRKNNLIEALVKDRIASKTRMMSQNNIKADVSNYIRMFLTKRTLWSWQKEWRIVGFAGEKPKAPRISKIIFGKNMATRNKNRLARFCEKYHINYCEE